MGFLLVIPLGYPSHFCHSRSLLLVPRLTTQLICAFYLLSLLVLEIEGSKG